ncbi:MAG: InlB B-repeat-containing protein [Candidatus Manganitrophus sp. SA1]|nr:InlB B-repeat-containing protein [Candidatus Manganitrophus morganii]
MIAMLSKPFYIFKPFGRFFVPLFFLLLIGGCGDGGDSKGPAAPVESDPAFSMPLPKGVWAPLPDSDLVMTAQAVIDPGTAGERTVDLTVDLSTNRVTGAIEGVPAGPHTVEIRYFINQVQVAAVTLSVDVVPGQNNPAEIVPAAIRYIEAVSDTLFVADAADPSIKMFDRYSTLPGGRVSTAPTRTLQGERTGIGAPSSGSLFVDSIGGGLYFADAQANSVSIWRNAAAVDGDTPPNLVLKGQATRLLHPTGIAVDPFRNRLYVVNNNGEILIWNLSSLEGGIPPMAVLTGSLAAGDHPVFLDVKRDTLYVANGREISVFEKPSGLTGDIQNVTPVPTIRIAGESLSQAGLVLDYSQNLLFISSRDPNGTIYRVAEASTISEEVVPAATLAGPETGLDQTAAVTLAGNVFMALNLAGTEIRVWHQADQKDGDRSPTQILELDPNASPEALFYVATQNGERDQAEETLQVEKPGNGHGTITSDLPGINCGTTCSASFAVGDTVTLTAAPEDDSTFDGWSGCDNATETSCTVAMNGAKTVAATFTLKPYSLSVSRVGTGTGTVISAPSGINCGNDCSESYDAHTQVILTATPSSDSDFTGWTGACGGTGNCVVTLDVAQSVTATFTLKTFALTVTKSGNGVGTVTSNPVGINCGSGAGCSALYDAHTQITLTAVPNANSNFSGWGGACTGSTTTCIVTMEAARSVTATFILKTFALTVTKAGDGNGTVTSNPVGINCGTACSQTYNINTQVTLTAAPAADSDFISWTGCDTANGTSCTVNMNAAKSVTATFNLKTFTLTLTKAGTGVGTVTSNPTGIDCGSACAHSYVINTAVILTAAPGPDADFISWAGCDSSTGNSCTVTMSSAKTVTATFNPEPLLTLRKAGNGSGTASAVLNGSTVLNCEPTCSTASVRLDRGTIITLTATPAAGSTFAGWSGNVADCNDGSVTMSAARNCVATFNLIQHTLTITQAGNGNGTVSGAGTYNFGSTATVTATANQGSTFAGWSGPNGTECATGSVTMDANKSCTATFTLQSLQVAVTKAGNGSGTVTSSPAGIDCGAICQANYNFGTVVTLTAATTNGSTFGGWSGDADCADGSVTVNAARNCTATFTLNQHTLTISQAGTGSGTVSGAGTYNFGAVATVTATANTGSTFGGWSGPNGTECATGSVTMNANKSCIATFTLNTFNLTVAKTGSGEGTVTSNPAGINCGTDCTETYDINTQVNLTANPSSDSLFTGWSGACTGTGSCVVTMDAAKSVTATFTLQTFPLTVTKTSGPTAGTGTVTSSPAGIDCGTDCTQDYTAHTVVTLTARPDADAVFAGWAGACTNMAGDCVVTMDAAQSVEAKFTKTFTLTVSLDPAGNGSGRVTGPGINCGDSPTDCSEVYTMGTTIELAAEPELLSQFSGWSGDCTGTTSPCTLFIDSNKSVQARFDLVVLPAE